MDTTVENEPTPLIEKMGKCENATGYMAVMSREAGDTKYMWDKNDAGSVEEAKETFKRFKKKGYLAYKAVGKDGTKGEQIHEFDPEAERIIFTPAMSGG